jgi:hypothetical protein
VRRIPADTSQKSSALPLRAHTHTQHAHTQGQRERESLSKGPKLSKAVYIDNGLIKVPDNSRAYSPFAGPPRLPEMEAHLNAIERERGQG